MQLTFRYVHQQFCVYLINDRKTQSFHGSLFVRNSTILEKTLLPHLSDSDQVIRNDFLQLLNVVIGHRYGRAFRAVIFFTFTVLFEMSKPLSYSYFLVSKMLGGPMSRLANISRFVNYYCQLLKWSAKTRITVSTILHF